MLFYLKKFPLAVELFSFLSLSLSSSCFSVSSFLLFLEYNKKNTLRLFQTVFRAEMRQTKKIAERKKLPCFFAAAYSLFVWSESAIFSCAV